MLAHSDRRAPWHRRENLFPRLLLCFIPVLGLLEGGGSYQRIAVVPLWLEDIKLMQTHAWGGPYFLALAPVSLALWVGVVISGWGYHGPARRLLMANHAVYLLIVVATAVYFVPFLGEYVGRDLYIVPEAIVQSDLGIWARWSLLRQVVGFVVLASYVRAYGMVRREPDSASGRLV